MDEADGHPRLERVPPGARMAGALWGLLGAARALPDSGQGLRDSVAELLSSLEANARFVLADSLSRFEAADLTPAQGTETLLRCLPLACWLRGPDDRVALATVRLAETMEVDAETGIASAFVNQWLRNLFEGVQPAPVWRRTLKDMEAITAFLGTDPDLWDSFRSAILSPSLSTVHPVTLSIRRVGDALQANTNLRDLMDELGRTGADTETMALGACLGGTVFGDRQAREIWPESELSDAERAWVHTIGERGGRLYRLHRWPPETSRTHPLPIAAVTLGSGARVAVSPAPGRRGFDSPHAPIDRDMDLDAQRIAAWGARHVVSLVETDALLDGDMGALGPTLESHGITCWHVPPSSDPADAWFKGEGARVTSSLAQSLADGQSVLIHGLDFGEPANLLAARLLVAVGGAGSVQEALQQVEIAVQVAMSDFSAHDQDQ